MTSHELTTRVDETAASVPGVRRLFAADRSPIAAARQVTAGHDRDAALSSVRERAGELEITVSVELDGSRPAAETAADVAAAVREAAGGGASVHVRVSRVAGSGAPGGGATAPGADLTG